MYVIDGRELRVEETRKGHPRGWSFTPLRGKRPYLTGWQEAERGPLAQAVEWAEQGNIGLRTGAASGVVVVDIDVAKGGSAEGLDLPPTVTVLTGGGGQHLYFAAPNVQVPNSTGKLAPHVDVRGDGGCVVFVGSVHPDTTEVYRWAEGGSPDDIPLAPFPGHLLVKLLPAEQGPPQELSGRLTLSDAYLQKALAGEVERVRAAGHGERNHTLNLAAYRLGQLVPYGLSREETQDELLKAAVDNGLPAPESRRTITSGLGKGSLQPRVVCDRQPARTGIARAGAPLVAPGEILPLRRELPPPLPYPIQHLGVTLGAAAQALHEVVQAPLAVCAHSVLAVGAFAAQAQANLNVDGRSIPISMFMLTIADSGERKSAVDSVALTPVNEFRMELCDRYGEDVARYRNQKDAFEAIRNEIKRKHVKTHSREQLERALAGLGPEPVPPLQPYIVVQEPTYEALVKQLQGGYPSLALFSNEGGRLIGGHAFSTENGLKTLAGLSELWDGQPVDRLRAGDGGTVLFGRRVSMHLMMQPVVALQILGNKVMMDQGFLARTLIAWPPSMAGSRSYCAIDLSEHPAIASFWTRIRMLLRMPLPLAEGKQNELQPGHLQLTPEGKELYVALHDGLDREMAEGMPLSPIRGFASKAAEHALRLAAVLTVVDDPQARVVDDTRLLDAMGLLHYYLNEWLRLVGASAMDPQVALAVKVWQWIQQRGLETVTLPDLYQYGPPEIRSADRARPMSAMLEAHGYLIRLPDGAGDIDGTHRKDAWKVAR